MVAHPLPKWQYFWSSTKVDCPLQQPNVVILTDIYYQVIVKRQARALNCWLYPELALERALVPTCINYRFTLMFNDTVHF